MSLQELSPVSQQPENPYTSHFYEKSGDAPLVLRSLAHKTNPLVSQQDFAKTFLFFKKWLKEEEKSLLLNKILESSSEDFGHMMCGLSACLTALREIAYEQEWKDIPNLTSSLSLLPETLALHGSPTHNPETGEEYGLGWLVFANTDSEKGIVDWEIYHHALARAVEILGKENVKTSGIKSFTLEQIRSILSENIKLIVSVKNSIVPIENFNPLKSDKLKLGTHLVALLGISDDGQWIMLADPYIESFSERSDNPIPQWMKFEEFEKYLKDKQNRYGIAVASSEIDLEEILGNTAYLLTKPDEDKQDVSK